MFRKIYFALALITLLSCAACRNNTAGVSSEYKSEIAFTENSENIVAPALTKRTARKALYRANKALKV